jgi:hypothetical protein
VLWSPTRKGRSIIKPQVFLRLTLAFVCALLSFRFRRRLHPVSPFVSGFSVSVSSLAFSQRLTVNDSPCLHDDGNDEDNNTHVLVAYLHFAFSHKPNLDGRIAFTDICCNCSHNKILHRTSSFCTFFGRSSGSCHLPCLRPCILACVSNGT